MHLSSLVRSNCSPKRSCEIQTCTGSLAYPWTWEYTPVPKLLLPWFVSAWESQAFEGSSTLLPLSFCLSEMFCFFVLPFLSLSSDSPFFFSLSRMSRMWQKTPHDSDPLRSTWWNTQDQRHRCWGAKSVSYRRATKLLRKPVIGLEEAKLRRPSFGVMVWILFATSHPYSTDPHQGLWGKDSKILRGSGAKKKDEIEGEQRCTTLQSFLYSCNDEDIAPNAEFGSWKVRSNRLIQVALSFGLDIWLLCSFGMVSWLGVPRKKGLWGVGDSLGKGQPASNLSFFHCSEQGWTWHKTVIGTSVSWFVQLIS